MSPRPVKCACGRSISWAGTGRRPEKCERCSLPAEQRRRGERKGKTKPLTEDLAASTAARKRREDRHARTILKGLATKAHKLALVLGIEPIVERAARLVDIDPASEDFAELRRIAESDGLKPLRTGEPSEINRLLAVAIGLTVLEVIERVHEVPAIVLPGAPKALISAQQLLGGANLTFSETEVHFGRLHTPTEDPSKAA